MFHAEKTYGIEKFYNLAQKNLQTQQKKDGYASVSEIPEWRYLRDNQSADEQSILFYFRKDRHSNLPLSLTIKSPKKEQFSKLHPFCWIMPPNTAMKKGPFPYA